MLLRIAACIAVLTSLLRYGHSQNPGITWAGFTVVNNSLVTLGVVLPRVSATSASQVPLVCQGITGGQWYQPNGILFPLATPDPVSTPGGLGQRNWTTGVELYRGSPSVFPHGVQCCTNTTITLCVGMYTDLALATNVTLAISNLTNYALSVAATYGPNITANISFQLLTPTNVDPPVFQLTCTSTSSPPTSVQWTFNGSPVNGTNTTSSQIVIDRPTSTYNNTLTVTGRSPGMYTCTITTTCSPVCGATGFTLNPRSASSSLTVQGPPDPPTGVTAVQSGPSSVNVSWTAPSSGGPVIRYDIYYVARGVPSTSGGSITSTSYVLTNLQVGVEYNISVIAVGTYLGSQIASTAVVPALGNVYITGSVTTPTAGSPHTLTCTVPVIGWNEMLTINLTASNGSILNTSVISASPGKTYTLQWSFFPLHTSDGGLYTCEVFYQNYTLGSMTSSLIVTIPSPTVTIMAAPSQVVIAGSNLILLCNVQLNPSVDSPVMVNSTWTTPGGAALSGSNPLWIGSSNQTTLTLSSLGTGDAGNYLCGVSITPINAQYINGPMGTSGSILVSVHTINITTSGSPVAGQMYTLTCTGRIVGNTSLTPVVTWYNSTGVVSSGNDITVTNGDLTFNPLRTSHGGQYTCQSTLNSPYSVTTAAMNIIVKIPPPTVTITSTPITTSYYAGTPLNLTCNVQLLPQVDTNVTFNYLWTGPTGQISSAVSRVSLSSGVSQTSVQFYPLNTTDTGVYNCSVSVVSASGQLYVDTSIAVSSSMTSITVNGLPAPQVSITPSGSSTAGSPYTLTCTVMVVNGLIVVPQVMWLKNGTSVVGGIDISLAQLIVVGNRSNLLLQYNPLHTSHGGQYTCIANVSIPVISISSLYTTSQFSTIVQIPPPAVTPLANPSQTVSQGDNIVITCGSQVNDYVDTPVMVTTTWTGPRGGGVAGSNTALVGGTYQSSLNLTSLTPDGAGTYNCSVSVLPNNPQYVVGVGSYNTIEVALHTVTIITSTTTPTAGMNYTLTCMAVTSNNVPSAPLLSWNEMMSENLFLGAQSSDGNTASLSISFVPLYTSDGGTYTCQSNLSYPVVSAMTKSQDTIIQIPSPYLTITTPNPVVLDGGSIDLTCQVKLDPSVDSPVMVNSTWTTPGGATLSGSNPLWIGSSNKTTLTLSSLGTGDAGNYTCLAIILPLHPVLLQTSGTSSLLVSVHTINITTSGSPAAGQMYTLTCTGRIVGNTSLTPVVTWYNSTGGVVSSGNSIIVSNGVLTFNPLHTSHGGQYTCQSTLNSPYSLTTVTMNIIVQIPPPTVTITSTPITTSYYAGTPLNLTCNVQLLPQVDTDVTVTPVWFRGGSSDITIDNYTTISPMIGSSSYVTTLMFNPLGAADSGRYSCNVNVSVQPGAPYVTSAVGGASLSLQVLDLPAPNVTITPSLPLPSLGAPYSLTCQAMEVTGLALPVSFTWTRAGGVLGSNRTLLLGPLTMSDLTSYNCTAVISLPYKGIYSVGSSAVDVAVRAPGVVSSPAVSTLSDSSSVISWSTPQLTYGRLTGYVLSIVQLMDYGVPVRTTTNISVDITVTSHTWSGLDPGVPYQTCISAVNPLGLGDPWCKVFFTREEIPNAAPSGVLVTRSSDGASMNISWSPLTLSDARGFPAYVITYGPPGSVKRQALSKSLTVNDTFASVTGLEATGMYSVSVAGRTVAGQGPSSAPQLSVSPVSNAAPAGPIAAGAVGGVFVVAIVVVIALVVVLLMRSKKQGKLTFRSKSKNLFSPVEVISNGNRNSSIQATGFSDILEMEVKAADIPVVPSQASMAETNPEDTFTEKESAIATEVSDRTRPISIASFRDHVQRMHMERNKGFEQEYKSLKPAFEGPHDIAKLPCNNAKNRFANIYPYDDGRVKLKETTGVAGSDYINASYINGYKYENCYIAAQGPTENTLATFWRMIWENRIQMIVMLTKCIESGKKKCEQYFSESTGGTFETDTVLVTTVSTVPYADFEIKKLTVKSKTEPDAEPLKITHYHYTSWPDHGVPQFATSILSFVRKIQKSHDKSKGVPLLVHCSAGVGRTGTFIVLDTMMERIKVDDSINIYGYVQEMRKRRTLMVQTEDQYVFIHDALDEYITCGETDIVASNLRARLNKLRKHIPEKGITGFLEQFQLLEQVSNHATEENCNIGLELYNKNKNRYLDKLPYNSKRVFLKSTGAQGSEYINAGYVDGYKQLNAYIATQGPLQNTVDDFWRMVWEFKCRVIVMLCPLTEEGHESSYCYWPTQEGQSTSYGKISVTLQSTVSYDVFLMRKFNVKEEKSEEQDTVVTQLHYTEWPEHGRPPNTASVVEMMDTLTRTQISTGNKPIVVHCNDGMGRTGTFICMHAELERVKTEGVADVFQRVKRSRALRPGMVPELDQYIYCHEVLTDFVEKFDTYSNFKASDF